MSVEDRRTHIVGVTIPLLLEHGAEVTTREIADAACIAEGTVFRAFADKNELIDACIARVMDPTESLDALARVDSSQGLENTIQEVVELLHRRVGSVVRFMGALGPRDHARRQAGHDHTQPPLAEATAVVERLLEPYAHRLRVPVATAVEYLRILVFGTAMPFLTSGTASEPSQLADFILRGIAKEGD